jgi:hypothetical protein
MTGTFAVAPEPPARALEKHRHMRTRQGTHTDRRATVYNLSQPLCRPAGAHGRPTQRRTALLAGRVKHRRESRALEEVPVPARTARPKHRCERRCVVRCIVLRVKRSVPRYTKVYRYKGTTVGSSVPRYYAAVTALELWSSEEPSTTRRGRSAGARTVSGPPVVVIPVRLRWAELQYTAVYCGERCYCGTQQPFKDRGQLRRVHRSYKSTTARHTNTHGRAMADSINRLH